MTHSFIGKILVAMISFPVQKVNRYQNTMLVRNTAIYVLSRVLSGIINFATIAIFTHLLKPSEYGIYTLVLSSAYFFMTILTHWLKQGLMRFIPRYQRQGRLSDILITICTLFVLISTISSLLAILVYPLVATHINFSTYLLGIATFWGQGAFFILLAYLSNILAPVQYGLFNIVRALTALTISGSLAWLGGGATAVLLGVAISYLFPPILAWLINSRQIVVGIDLAIFKRVISYGLPFVAIFGLLFFINLSDRYLINYFLGTAATGLYGSTADFTYQSITMLQMAINLASYPLIIRALEQCNTKGQQMLAQNFNFQLLVTLPIIACLTLLSKNICNLLFGHAYQQAATQLMPIIALSTAILNLKSYHFDLHFQLAKQTAKQAWGMLVTALANILLNILLIPKLGIMGAAYATLIAVILGTVISAIWGHRVFKSYLEQQSIIKIAIASFSMAMVLYLLPPSQGLLSLIAQLFVAIITYISMSYILNICNIQQVVKQRIALLD